MLYVILAAVAASLAAVLGSVAILLLGKRAERAAIWILSFAIGTLGGAATLHLLPEALERAEPREVFPIFLATIIAFIAFERALRWRHAEDHEHPAHAVTAKVLLIGDAVHNLIDGFMLGVTFRASTDLGMVAAVAVFAHEIPQEIGDFAVLLGTGMSRRRALVLNYLSASTVIPGALLAFLWSGSLDSMIGLLLPIAAGGFLYIALADLVPTLHHQRGAWAAIGQIALIVSGAVVMWVT